MQESRGLIIYDFDGVIADSELLANAELADIVTELGVPTTLEDLVPTVHGQALCRRDGCDREHRSGNSLPSWVCGLVSGAYARAVPAGAVHRPRCARAHRGIPERRKVHRVLFLAGPPGPVPWTSSGCNRSSGPMSSAPHPSRGASRIPISSFMRGTDGRPPGAMPGHRRQPLGVEAGRAAGMTVIGLLAASHIQADHHERLQRAGAPACRPHVSRKPNNITRAFLADALATNRSERSGAKPLFPLLKDAGSHGSDDNFREDHTTKMAISTTATWSQ